MQAAAHPEEVGDVVAQGATVGMLPPIARGLKLVATKITLTAVSCLLLLGSSHAEVREHALLVCAIGDEVIKAMTVVEQALSHQCVCLHALCHNSVSAECFEVATAAVSATKLHAEQPADTTSGEHIPLWNIDAADVCRHRLSQSWHGLMQTLAQFDCKQDPGSDDDAIEPLLLARPDKVLTRRVHSNYQGLR